MPPRLRQWPVGTGWSGSSGSRGCVEWGPIRWRERAEVMHDASAEPAGAGRGRHWRLVGVPSPTLSERLSRAVGLRVFRVLGSRRVFVVAGSMDRLRDLLADPASLAPTRRATVLVAWWRAPWRGWSGGVGSLRPYAAAPGVAAQVGARGRHGQRPPRHPGPVPRGARRRAARVGADPSAPRPGQRGRRRPGAAAGVPARAAVGVGGRRSAARAYRDPRPRPGPARGRRAGPTRHRRIAPMPTRPAPPRTRRRRTPSPTPPPGTGCGRRPANRWSWSTPGGSTRGAGRPAPTGRTRPGSNWISTRPAAGSGGAGARRPLGRSTGPAWTRRPWPRCARSAW